MSSSRASSVRSLLAYTLWADRQFLSAAAALPGEDLARETGSSHGSALGTLAHMLISERIWLSRCLGSLEDPEPTAAEYRTLEQLVAGWGDLAPQLEFFLASLNEESLDRELTWRTGAGETRSAPCLQVLLHFVNHATYHRGQVASQLRQLGHEPQSTDLIHWSGSF